MRADGGSGGGSGRRELEVELRSDVGVDEQAKLLTDCR